MKALEKRHAERVERYSVEYRDLFASASPSAVVNGADWYPAANREVIQRLAKDYKTPRETVAAIVAVTSPQTTVRENVRASEAILSGADTAGILVLGPNVEKAREILAGNLSALRGPKVEAFARALLLDLSSVVIDIHMINALATFDTSTLTLAQYKAAADAVRNVARFHGLQPATVQAIIWNVERERKGLPLNDTRDFRPNDYPPETKAETYASPF